MKLSEEARSTFQRLGSNILGGLRTPFNVMSLSMSRTSHQHHHHQHQRRWWWRWVAGPFRWLQTDGHTGLGTATHVLAPQASTDVSDLGEGLLADVEPPSPDRLCSPCVMSTTTCQMSYMPMPEAETRPRPHHHTSSQIMFLFSFNCVQSSRSPTPRPPYTA